MVWNLASAASTSEAMEETPWLCVGSDIQPCVSEVRHLLCNSPMHASKKLGLYGPFIGPNVWIGEEIFSNHIVRLRLLCVEEVKKNTGMDSDCLQDSVAERPLADNSAGQSVRERIEHPDFVVQVIRCPSQIGFGSGVAHNHSIPGSKRRSPNSNWIDPHKTRRFGFLSI